MNDVIGSPAAPTRVWTRWARRGFWAVMDQGLFAISNFALSLMLARSLPAEEFGAFAVGFAIFLLVGTVHTALLTEPMLIYGSGKYADRFPDYLRLVLRGHLLLTGACGVLLSCVGLGMLTVGLTLLGKAFLGFSMAAPLILLSWLLRRACYVPMRPHDAAISGGIYLLLMCAGIYGLSAYHALTVSRALAVLAISSAVASVWLAFRLLRQPKRGIAQLHPIVIAQEHWSYGRWAVGSSALSWIPSNIFYIALPLWGGLQASAALKALMTLIMPLVQAKMALTTLLVPALVRARGQPRFLHLLRVSAGLLVSGSLLYWLALGSFNQPILHVVFQGKYDEYGALLWWLGLLPVFMAVASVLKSALRALERPDRVFWGNLASTLFVLSLGLGAVVLWGLAGAVSATVMSYLLLALYLWFSLPRLRNVSAGSILPVPRAGSTSVVEPVALASIAGGGSTVQRHGT